MFYLILEIYIYSSTVSCFLCLLFLDLPNKKSSSHDMKENVLQIGYFGSFCIRTLWTKLDTWESTGRICQIEIHFLSNLLKFLMNYNLVCFQISGWLIVFFTKYDC